MVNLGIFQGFEEWGLKILLVRSMYLSYRSKSLVITRQLYQIANNLP